MRKNFVIKTYNIFDLRNWISGVKNGLNTSIYSKHRAIAQINNPEANDEDIILSIAFLNDECIGYRSVFPEKLKFKESEVLFGWLGTTWVEPKYRGEGIANDLLKPIFSYYKEYVSVINSSDNAIRVYQKLSWKINTFKLYRYHLLLHKLNKKSLANNIINYSRPFINFVQKLRLKKWLKESSNRKFSIEYNGFIDDDLFRFISKFDNDYMFNRSREKMNWILTYKWSTSSPSIKRLNKDYYFTDYLRIFEQYAISVKLNNKIIGFFIIRNNNRRVTIPYLFYKFDKREYVFISILENLLEINCHFFTTSDKEFSIYVETIKLKTLYKQIIKRSFSHPNFSLFSGLEKKLHDGDGDLFF